MKRVSIQLVTLVFCVMLLSCAPTDGVPGDGASTSRPSTPQPLPTRTAAPPSPARDISSTPRPTYPPLVSATPFSDEKEAPPRSYNLNDVTITLERTVCFGTCPAYSVSVQGDGTVNYNGAKFVAVLGTKQKQISRDAVVALLHEFYTIDFFILRPEYQNKPDITVNADGTVQETQVMVTDLPSTIVTLTIGDYSKRVLAYYGAPDSIYTLATHIDETTGTAAWVK